VDEQELLHCGIGLVDQELVAYFTNRYLICKSTFSVKNNLGDGMFLFGLKNRFYIKESILHQRIETPATEGVDLHPIWNLNEIMSSVEAVR
jgi:hypothetical protein